jgi:hypothetical protein
MKKTLIVLFMISMVFPCLANATYHLEWFSVQNRVYENGNHQNRLMFDCKDANGNYAPTDVLGSVVLTDPNGKIVDVKPSFYSYVEVDGYYDTNNGQWVYSKNTPYLYSGYWSKFSDQLIVGQYHLKFTDKDGEASEKDFVINQIVDLPIIPTSSYTFHVDQNVDLIWQWQVPDYIDPSLQTSARAWIDCYDENDKLIAEVLVRIPTQMGFLFVPRNVVEQLVLIGKKFGFGTQIRTNDNNNRSYSTGLKTQ